MNLFGLSVTDINVSFSFCFQGKRDESTTVDTAKAKEDAKVTQKEFCFLYAVSVCIYA